MAIPRNRIVVFRLTQQEYETLKSACSEKGGRNLSEFTRSELLTLVDSGCLSGMLEKRFTDLEHRLSEMHLLLQRLAQRVVGAGPLRRHPDPQD